MRNLDINKIIIDLQTNKLTENELVDMHNKGYISDYQLDTICNLISRIEESNGCKVGGATVETIKNAYKKGNGVIDTTIKISKVFYDGLKTSAPEENHKYQECLKKSKAIKENTAATAGSFAPVSSPVVRHVNPYAGQTPHGAYYNNIVKPMARGVGQSLLNAGKTTIGYDPKSPSWASIGRKYIVNKIANKFVQNEAPYAHTANMILNSR